MEENLKRAIFGGGCFWCIHAQFQGTEGVRSVTSGYMGGRSKNPSYERVSTGVTGHAEVIEVTYDPAQVSYAQLLDLFWKNIDPTDAGGQFYDRGSQYRTGIYYTDEEQHAQAQESKQKIERQLQKSVATEILPAADFYAAEEYHQDYDKKNPVHYNAYKQGSGREAKLKKIWGDN